MIEHRAELAGERHGEHVRDRVRHLHHLDRERAGVEGLARRARPRPARPAACARRASSAPSRPSAGRRRSGRACAELAQHERQRADVVLVPVREHDRLDVLGALAQVGEVGQHEVDAELVGRRGTSARCRPPRSGRRTRRPSCSCRSRRARRAAGPAACSLTPRSSRPWRSSTLADHRSLLLGRLDHRQPQRRRRRCPIMFMAVFTGIGLVVTDIALRGRASCVVDLVALVGLVDHAPHLAPDEVRGHADPAGAAHVEHLGEHVVVAGEQVHARRSARCPRSAPASRPLTLSICGQLGEQVVGHVDHAARRDVVERRSAGRWPRRPPRSAPRSRAGWACCSTA